MSISVYSQDQNAQAIPRPVAKHLITRRLSVEIVKSGIARRVGQNAIQLTTGTMTWAEIKRMARAHVDPLLVQPTLPIREYPPQMTCMEVAFQRCMRYPVQLAEEQRSHWYSWEVPA